MNPIYKFELNRPTVNLLNPKTTVNGLLSVNTGNFDSYDSVYQTSDFIPVTPGTNYKLCDKETFTAWAAAAACFYTANKTFISGSYGIANTPSNAAYLRVSMQGLNDYGVFASNVSSYSDYVTPIAYPVYKDDLAKDYEKESGQEFFRAKLSGKLTFQSLDYDFIVAQPFDFQFILEIFISYNAGQSWTLYWRGTFWKTDCEFDNDAKTVVVQPTVWDQYNDVLAGMDKEYNLIELAPEIVPVKADKRPMIQVYVPGQSVIGCFLSGMWWEQEAEPESDETKLVNDFKFSLNKVMTIGEISGSMSPQLPDLFNKTFAGDERFTPTTPGTTDFPGSVYTLRYYFSVGGGGYTQRWQILRNSDSTVMWEWANTGGGTPVIQDLPVTVTLSPVSGTGATGNVTLYVHDMPVYSRFVLDTPQISGLNTYPIPDDDIVENNRNYTRVIGYYFPDTIYFSTSLTSTPNQWGLYQPGQYYQPPYLYWSPELFPVARNAWGRVSIWFTFSAVDWIVEESGRQSFTIRHAYPLASVISKLLEKVAPEISHDGTPVYSKFLYSQTTEQEIQNVLLIQSRYISVGYGGAFVSSSNGMAIAIYPIVSGDKYTIQIPKACNNASYILAYVNTAADHLTDGQVTEFTDTVGTNAAYNYTINSALNYNYLAVCFFYSNGLPVVIQTHREYINPSLDARLFITPKSNLITAGYDQPAQKAPITLKNVTDMLRDCFRCYWFIDEQNRFRVEHIQYFRNGGSYSGSPVVGIDLTTQQVPRNGKPWAFARDQFKFDKPAMAARYQFGWMDDVTQLFDGFPIDIISKYVNPDNIEQIDVSRFTSDIDYILLNPGAVSKDGFVLLGAIPQSGGYALPYVNFNIDGNDHILQNAYVAFCLLQQYYAYDMPAPLYSINGEQMMAQGIKKLKNQSIRFPALTDPDLVELVKTNLGNGTIEKLSVNLSSRNANATLKYDTE